MYKDISDLTILTIDLIDIVKKCTDYDFDIKLNDEYVKSEVIRRKIKLCFRTEEILTIVINIKDELDCLETGKVKLLFKNKQSQTVYLKDMVNCLRVYFRDHKLEEYSLSTNCSIIVDKSYILDKINSTINNIRLNKDTETGSKYFSITYTKDNQIRNFGYNSDLLKLYNKKFRGKEPKILNW